jgi:O-antigen/teichoic acid export membrane protein
MTETSVDVAERGDLKRETFLYGVSIVVSGLVQAAFLPFVSVFLPAAAAGELGALRVTSEAVAGIVVLGLPTALVKMWQVSRARRSILLRAMGVPLVPALVMAVLLFALKGPLASLLRLDHPDYLYHALLLGVAVAYVQVLLALPRAEGLAGKYLTFQLVRGVGSVGLLALLLFGGWGGVPAFLSARWIPSYLVVAGVIAMMWRSTVETRGIGPEKPIAPALLSFGLPLVPASLAMIVLSSADIYMLRNIYPDLAESGYYEWASRVCMVLVPLVLGFRMAWHRFIFRRGREGGRMEELGRLAMLFMIMVNWAALVLAMASPEISWLVGGSTYYPASRILPWLAGSSAMYALFLVSQTGPLLTGHTKLIGAMTVLGAVLNIIFNLRLIPVAGGVGAAFATLATNLFMALSLFWMGRRIFPISFLAVTLIVLPPIVYGPLADLSGMVRGLIALGGSVLVALLTWALRAAGARLKGLSES